MKKNLLGTKFFSKEEQKNFNINSLDYNPAHIFNSKKNQFNTRKPVVHGINILLTSLELYLKKNKANSATIDCNFLKPVYLDKIVKFYKYKQNKNENFIEIKSDGVLCAKIFISKIDKLTKDNTKEKNEYIFLKKKNKFYKINPTNLIKKTFKITFDKKKNTRNYPLIQKNFGELFCKSMFAVSFFVGMVCPGKYAIFTNLKFEIKKNEKKKYLLFYVKNYDYRISLFKIFVSGFMKMNIKSFYKHV
jgi:hypothetical protein